MNAEGLPSAALFLSFAGFLLRAHTGGLSDFAYRRYNLTCKTLSPHTREKFL